MARSSRARRQSIAVGLALIAVAAAGTSVSAHRHDELLQAARIRIDRQRVALALSLTAGTAVANSIIGAIDRDRDGRLSAEEQRDYATEVMSALQLTVDGRPLRMVATVSSFPAVDILRGGAAPIELHFAAALPAMPPGTHRVSFDNQYRRDIGVYLTNALLPDDERITISNQHRDSEQRSTTIAYLIASQSSALLPLWLAAPFAAAWLLIRRRLLPS